MGFYFPYPRSWTKVPLVLLKRGLTLPLLGGLFTISCIEIMFDDLKCLKSLSVKVNRGLLCSKFKLQTTEAIIHNWLPLKVMHNALKGKRSKNSCNLFIKLFTESTKAIYPNWTFFSFVCFLIYMFKLDCIRHIISYQFSKSLALFLPFLRN